MPLMPARSRLVIFQAPTDHKRLLAETLCMSFILSARDAARHFQSSCRAFKADLVTCFLKTMSAPHAPLEFIMKPRVLNDFSMGFIAKCCKALHCSMDMWLFGCQETRSSGNRQPPFPRAERIRTRISKKFFNSVLSRF